MKAAIGVEIGGTKLQAGVGFRDEKLISLVRAQVDAARGGEGIREALPSLMEQALRESGLSRQDIAGIGVGFGGPIDSKTGTALVSHQIEGWDNFPLKQWLEESWNVPASIQNDATLAGYAEAMMGAGRGLRRIFYITIGSGIGGGLITDGVMDEGQGLGAAEIGHTWIPDPETGEPEKLELVCSGWSIGRRAREAVEAGESSIMPELAGSSDAVTAQTVYTAAERDDLLANALLEDTCTALAIAISNVIALLHPERIVIGGGVSLMGPLFWDALRQKVKQFVFKPFMNRYEIVPAALGEEVVIMGAVLLGQKIGGVML
ncbi:MAG: ROK family protein [Candidatus Omnitrophota bacterium]